MCRENCVFVRREKTHTQQKTWGLHLPRKRARHDNNQTDRPTKEADNKTRDMIQIVRPIVVVVGTMVLLRPIPIDPSMADLARAVSTSAFIGTSSCWILVTRSCVSLTTPKTAQHTQCSSRGGGGGGWRRGQRARKPRERECTQKEAHVGRNVLYQGTKVPRILQTRRQGHQERRLVPI